MFDYMIADLLDHCLDLDEELTLIERQLKCLAGLPDTPETAWRLW